MANERLYIAQQRRQKLLETLKGQPPRIIRQALGIPAGEPIEPYMVDYTYEPVPDPTPYVPPPIKQPETVTRQPVALLPEATIPDTQETIGQVDCFSPLKGKCDVKLSKKLVNLIENTYDTSFPIPSNARLAKRFRCMPSDIDDCLSALENAGMLNIRYKTAIGATFRYITVNYEKVRP